jgi:hypothetical protein
MQARSDRSEQRTFGLVVGGIFGLIGIWPAVIRGGHIRLWALGVTALLVLPALLAPRVLGPAHRAWMALGSVLSWVNNRLILGLVFFGLITPIGLVIRRAGRDPMRRPFNSEANTYREHRSPRPGDHMLRQF